MSKDDSIIGKLLGGGNSGGCCGRKVVSVTQVEIDGEEIEIKGMEEVFEGYYTKGKRPEELSSKELVSSIEENNHVPDSKRENYAEALEKEYREFYRNRK